MTLFSFFFFQAEDGIRDLTVTGVQTCALPILAGKRLAPMGLTVRLCGVLNLLAKGAISQQELGEQLGIDRTTIVELIDELERQGVVVRRSNAADRRSYALVLTPKGRAVQKRASKAFDEAADEFFGALKPTERQLLSDMMRRLIAAADEKLGKTPKVP